MFIVSLGVWRVCGGFGWSKRTLNQVHARERKKEREREEKSVLCQITYYTVSSMNYTVLCCFI